MPSSPAQTKTFSLADSLKKKKGLLLEPCNWMQFLCEQQEARKRKEKKNNNKKDVQMKSQGTSPTDNVQATKGENRRTGYKRGLIDCWTTYCSATREARRKRERN